MSTPGAVASEKVVPCTISPLDICEVNALLRYASERGIDSDGVIVRPLLEAVQRYEGLVQRSEGATANEQQQAETTTILIMYAKLTKLTHPVTGRTVMDTEQRFKWAISPLYGWTLLFLVAVVANEVLRVWFGDLAEPDEGGLKVAIDVHRYVLGILEPFLWGALGSCVYIIKRLSDIAEARTFDHSISEGWMARILLGAVLGGVVQYLYDSEAFLGGGLKLGANALGFLTGVGVKVVYGSIEKTIEVLGDKLNLSTLKSHRRDPEVIRTFLAEQLAKVDVDREPAKRETLVKLLEEVSKPPKAVQE